MSTPEEQIFLALATKNNLMSREQAAFCLRHFQDTGKPIQSIVKERGLLKDDQIEMLSEATRKVKQGQTGTLRGPAKPAPQAASPAAPAAPAAPMNPNEPIPGYPIVGKLGVGGTATVFLAEDKKNKGKQVALKVLKPVLAKDPKALQNFLREAKLLCEFDHPNLVKAYDYGTAGPLSYMVLEYLENGSVYELIQEKKKLPEAKALEILCEGAKGIDYIQKHGYVHRDIKPDNLMFSADGRVVLCDLGFAVPLNAEDAALGEEETTSGTVQYMSPEQAKGQRDIDIRTDIYSLGATLYHMVMGDVPFTGGDSHEVMAKQVLEMLNSSEIKNRRLSKHMHYFIERMMSKDKDLRYTNPEELVEDINAQIEGFRSLEFRPDESDHDDSFVLGGLKRESTPPPKRSRGGVTKRMQQKTTRASKKIDRKKLTELTKRFKKNR